MVLQLWQSDFEINYALKSSAPGEARTHNLRMAHSSTDYKYGALTDCATGAYTYLVMLAAPYRLTLLKCDPLQINHKFLCLQ